MLWNWNTIDTCFLAESWHIRSRGMFGGSCIGVICLVIVLEFLRRIAREYDAFIVHRAQLRAQYLSPAQIPVASSSSDNGDGAGVQKTAAATTTAPSQSLRVRPNLIEQLIRALLHMLQFAVAYFVMLLAMYFNGYIIICIFIGAFLGSFIFSWEPIGGGAKENDATTVTKCCG
ncbi:Ctr copper transporter [Aspergillus varians]